MSTRDETARDRTVEVAKLLARSPGVREIEHMLPSPVSVGKGSLGVEGGITVVAGSGMGRTSLLHQLQAALESERGIAAALVTAPAAEDYPGQTGFYRLLGDLVTRIREALLRRTGLALGPFAPVATELAPEPAWDVGADPSAMTPRGLAQWMTGLGEAAAHTPGVCLLFDDIDHAASATWSSAFVSALRFTFQTCPGVTPIYAAWSVFLDESAPGSNYFRNVTRPLFLEPFNAGECAAQVATAGIPAFFAPSVVRLAGGHPKLLQRVLADLGRAWAGRHTPAGDVAPSGSVDEVIAPDSRGAQVELAASLVARLPPMLVDRLRAIPLRPLAYRTLPRALTASGLVACGEGDEAFVPERVLAALGGP